MSGAQVLALLPRDPDGATPYDFLRHGATALVRDREGRMSLETLAPNDTFAEQVLTTGCFQRGKPIVDPVTRQVIGYEMEMIGLAGAINPRYAHCR